MLNSRSTIAGRNFDLDKSENGNGIRTTLPTTTRR